MYYYMLKLKMLLITLIKILKNEKKKKLSYYTIKIQIF